MRKAVGRALAVLLVVCALTDVAAASTPAADGLSGTAPDQTLTPGALDASVTTENVAVTVCSPTYQPPALSREARLSAYRRYGVSASTRSNYAIDRLIPLRLGGNNAAENVWPQTKVDARRKNSTEAALRTEVCAGHLALPDAQQILRADWMSGAALATNSKTAAEAAVAAYLEGVRQAQVNEYLRAVAAEQAQRLSRDCQNGTYVNTAGNEVCRPYESSTEPSGASAQCSDGTYSFSQSRSGTCSSHGGVARWL